MAANQVVLYFENQSDALRFTLAASSVLAAEDVHTNEAVVRVAQGICKASRITTEGSLSDSANDQDSLPVEHVA